MSITFEKRHYPLSDGQHHKCFQGELEDPWDSVETPPPKKKRRRKTKGKRVDHDESDPDDPVPLRFDPKTGSLVKFTP